MQRQRKLLRRLGAFAVFLSIYPLRVLAYTLSCVLRSDFSGGRHGPFDAYRPFLASAVAVVSYSPGEWGVEAMTWLMKSKGKDSNIIDRQ